MTERERAQDKLLCGIGFTLAGIVGREGHAEASESLHDLATGLKEESAKQDDEDNNGVRRVMGKKDCTDLPIPEDDCQACKGTGIGGPEGKCGACEGTGIAGKARARTPAVAPNDGCKSYPGGCPTCVAKNDCERVMRDRAKVDKQD